MTRLAACLRLLLWLLLVAAFGVGAPAQAREPACAEVGPAQASVALAELPGEARQTLDRIRRGGPFAYPHKDGDVFGNFEKRLPPKPRGYYREYTVATPGRNDRGARRIVAGDIAERGEFYYSDDHYRSFRRICR